MSASKESHGKTEFRIRPGGPFSATWKTFAGLGAVGLLGAAAGFAQDPKRFAYSYLFGYFCFLTPALGSLFFVAIQHLTKAGWSVTVRRTAEFFMKGLWVFALLALPIFASMGTLYSWTHEAHEGEHGEEHGQEHGSLGLTLESTAHAEEREGTVDPTHDTASPKTMQVTTAHDGESHGAATSQEHMLEEALEAQEHHILEGKKGYLNKGFFFVRAIFYFFVWWWLSSTFFRLSTEQDTSKKLELTAQAQRMSPMAVMLFGVSVTFACIDWVMALDPMWYSTIWGVQMFAGCVISMFAFVILTTLALRNAGLLGDAVNVEHFHDLGKLQFGFLVFWAYVTFSQFFLVWYSNVPEETTFYHRRWHDMNESWQGVSWVLFAVHFVLPFVFLLSRNVKRNLSLLPVGAGIILAMHFVELYWVVMPNLGELAISWIDISCFLGVGGVYLGYVFKTMTEHSLVPVGDPRLARALHFEQA